MRSHFCFCLREPRLAAPPDPGAPSPGAMLFAYCCQDETEELAEIVNPLSILGTKGSEERGGGAATTRGAGSGWPLRRLIEARVPFHVVPAAHLRLGATKYLATLRDVAEWPARSRKPRVLSMTDAGTRRSAQGCFLHLCRAVANVRTPRCSSSLLE